MNRGDALLDITLRRVCDTVRVDGVQVGNDGGLEVAVAVHRRLHCRESAADIRAEVVGHRASEVEALRAGLCTDFRELLLCDFADLVEELAEGELGAHLSETTSVVRNRAVGIGGEGDAKRGEHADGSDGDAVERGALVAKDDRDNDGKAGDDARDHANAEALDDNGGRGHEALF